MGEHGDSGGTISKERLDRFASLFDRFEYAIDPGSRDAKEAESEFSSLLDQIYRIEVEPKFSSITPAQFKAFVRRRCQALIVEQTKKPASPPASA